MTIINRRRRNFVVTFLTGFITFLILIGLRYFPNGSSKKKTLEGDWEVEEEKNQEYYFCLWSSSSCSLFCRSSCQRKTHPYSFNTLLAAFYIDMFLQHPQNAQASWTWFHLFLLLFLHPYNWQLSFCCQCRNALTILYLVTCSISILPISCIDVLMLKS